MKSLKANKHLLPAAVAVVAMAAVGVLGMTTADAAKGRKVGTVALVQGSASRAPGSGSWIDLSKGSAIYAGDKIKTGKKSRFEAKLKDGSVLRLGSGSELKLDKLSFGKTKKATKKISVKLFAGRMWASVSKLFGSKSKFEVRTHNAVAGVRGTSFSASTSKDGATMVKVYSGKVVVSNQPAYAVKGHTKANRVEVAGPGEVSKKAWEQMIASAMQMVQVAANGEISSAQSFELANAETDEWEAWNTERDKVAAIHE
ncbi:FecR domain-containing protein [Myxococcota bacterium]|nr:FecR domain-containing protein [Myxococcota bacterium]